MATIISGDVVRVSYGRADYCANCDQYKRLYRYGTTRDNGNTVRFWQGKFCSIICAKQYQLWLSGGAA